MRARIFEELGNASGARVDSLADALAKTLELETGLAMQLVELLTSLYALSSHLGVTVDDFAAALVDAVKRMPDAPPADWSALTRDLAKLPGLRESIGFAFKARDLKQENQRVWCHGRIVTDLRPICDLPLSGEGRFYGLSFLSTPARYSQSTRCSVLFSGLTKTSCG